MDKCLKTGTNFIRQADLIFTHHSPNKHLLGIFNNLHVTDVEEKVLHGKNETLSVRLGRKPLFESSKCKGRCDHRKWA